MNQKRIVLPAVNVNFHHLTDIVDEGIDDLALAILGEVSNASRHLTRIRGGLAALHAVTLERDDFVTTGDRTGALIQSFIADVALTTGRGEFDVNGLFHPALTFRDRRRLAEFPRWCRDLTVPSHMPYRRVVSLRIPNRLTVAIFGDWASGSPVAERVAESIRFAACDVVIHLGDVYYSGTPRETVNYLLGRWPWRPRVANRACNSNHEMYSGGTAYRDLTLKAFAQPDSFFVMENDYWVLVGLDTGTIDGRIDSHQRRELAYFVARLGHRKMLLLSHHPLYSSSSGVSASLLGDVREFMERGCIMAWYWAHDHMYARFDPDIEYSLHGRCVGHGSFPYPRYAGDGVVVRRSGPFTLRRMPPLPGLPGGVTLDGPSPGVRPPDRVGPSGWVRLLLDGPTLVEHVVDPDGVLRFEVTVA